MKSKNKLVNLYCIDSNKNQVLTLGLQILISLHLILPISYKKPVGNYAFVGTNETDRSVPIVFFFIHNLQ